MLDGKLPDVIHVCVNNSCACNISRNGVFCNICSKIIRYHPQILINIHAYIVMAGFVLEVVCVKIALLWY